tara:strand:+ start:362 stop:643 length:282 start_codon:yes stop_codon:yes gene_type:complete
MATKKAPAKKAPAKKKAEEEPKLDPRGAHFRTYVSFRAGEFDPAVLKFVDRVMASGGFDSPKDVVTAMMRMAMNNARAIGPRYFGPQLKRYLK